MASPIPGCAVSTPYGKRGPYWSCDEDSNGNGIHTGVDYAAAAGTDVVAPIPGQIRHRSYGSAFGQHQFAISPDPGQPFGDGEVFFAHMTSRPADGSWVKTGDYLGNVGAEGNVSGPHLHLEYHATTKGSWSCSACDDPAPVLAYTDDQAATDYLIGVDVSSNNSSNWEDDAWDYCWVKCSEGKSYKNPEYARQLGVVRDRGKVAGHYHWLNDGDVAAQIAWFDQNADVRPGELIAVDWEDPSDPTTAQKDDAIRRLQTMFPGNRVGLYCNRDWWLNHDTSSFYGDYLWIANYNGGTDPGIQATWTFWQYTASPYDLNRGRFDTLEDLRTWAACSTDPEPEPPPKPGWTGPTITLDDLTPDSSRNVSYMQAVVRVGEVTTDDGTLYGACYVVGQDYENKGNLKFGLFDRFGTYADQWMQVNDAGHGQTFHAYRSAAGNLYVWCGENPAYRYTWQPGKTVSRSSGTKMDYQGCRPVGSHEPWVGFRDATDTKETFHLFDRTDFTDGTNRTRPVKSVTISKQTSRSQQSWCLDEHRIYRISGSTNDNPPHGTNLHVVEVFDWSGTKLLSLDVTKMAISTTSDEPEGLTYTGTPGSVLAGKREGSSDPAKRSYPLWTLVGLP